MSGRLLLFCAVAPLAAYGQLQVFTFDGTTEKAVTAVTDLGTIATGDAREIRFRARNNGVAAAPITTLSLAGQGFSISSAPSIPYVVAPTNFAEIRVRFSAPAPGSYSATLAINTTQTLLRASAVSSATVSAAGSVLASGATIDFGRVQKGKSGSQDIRIANGTTSKLAVQSCAVSGGAFQAAGLQCPLSLAAGDAITVTISFDPKTSGVQTGSLTLDTRSFVLSGVAYDPPVPEPSITFDAPLASATQQRLSIRLAAVSETSGTGIVTMDFQPMTGATDDPAIRFTSSGGRTLSFQVKEGDQAASFPSGIDPVFQTGTTAGTIVFRVQLGIYDKQFSAAIAPAMIALDKSTAVRRTGDIDVSITGFDNTRTAGRFAFTFYDTSGQMVQPGAIRADWTDMFTNYFKTSQVGGSFMMRATFPVAGDASKIGGVEVEMTNSVGVTRTTRLSF